MSLTMFLVDCVAHGLVMDRAVLLGHGGTLLAVDGGAGLSSSGICFNQITKMWLNLEKLHN